MRLPQSPRPLYALLGASLIALALWGFWPKALAVEAATVARGPMTVTFSEEGRTRLLDRFAVSAPIDGVVERIALEPGDAVRAGREIVRMRPLNAAMFDPVGRAEALARLRAANQELIAAVEAVAAAAALDERLEAARRRAESLAPERLVSRDQLDEIRARSRAAQADLRAAQAVRQAAAARRDLARAVLALQGRAAPDDGDALRLLAPIDGRVIRRYVESEGPVKAGQPLLEIGDPHRLEVVVEALTSDATRVAPGTPVRLLHWGGTPLHGSLRRIEPGAFTKISALGVEEQRVLVVVALADAASAPPLGDGYRLEVEFRVWHSDSTLRVPVAALFRDGGAWKVYAIESGRARLRRVEIGRIGEDYAETIGGLEAGNRVVLYPGDRLRDGMRVEIAGGP